MRIQTREPFGPMAGPVGDECASEPGSDPFSRHCASIRSNLHFSSAPTSSRRYRSADGQSFNTEQTSIDAVRLTTVALNEELSRRFRPRLLHFLQAGPTFQEVAG